jgi:hypothetical protein
MNLLVNTNRSHWPKPDGDQCGRARMGKNGVSATKCGERGL